MNRFIDSVQSTLEYLSELVRTVTEGRIAPDLDDVVADDKSLGSRLQLRRMVSSLAAAGQLPGTHVVRIAEYDEQHRTAFEETIQAHLSCGGNAVEAAKALDVHVNTVRYRPSWVKPLFGIDLDDPETPKRACSCSCSCGRGTTSALWAAAPQG